MLRSKYGIGVLLRMDSFGGTQNGTHLGSKICVWRSFQNGQIILKKKRTVAIDPSCQLNHPAFLCNQYNLSNAEKNNKTNKKTIAVIYESYPFSSFIVV